MVKNDAKSRALAELMLLDYNILGLSMPHPLAKNQSPLARMQRKLVPSQQPSSQLLRYIQNHYLILTSISKRLDNDADPHAAQPEIAQVEAHRTVPS